MWSSRRGTMDGDTYASTIITRMDIEQWRWAGKTTNGSEIGNC
jgi:hypothetical protein